MTYRYPLQRSTSTYVPDIDMTVRLAVILGGKGKEYFEDDYDQIRKEKSCACSIATQKMLHESGNDL